MTPDVPASLVKGSNSPFLHCSAWIVLNRAQPPQQLRVLSRLDPLWTDSLPGSRWVQARQLRQQRKRRLCLQQITVACRRAQTRKK